MKQARYCRRAHFLTAFVLSLAGVVFVTPSLAGTFSVYRDQDGNCSISDAQAGSISVYVYHRSPPWDLGVTGSAFRLGSGGGFTGVFESVNYGPGYLTLGDITQGVEVAYGSCLNDGSILVAVVTYTVFGTSAACSYLEVLPFGDGGVVETYRCNDTMDPAPVNSPLIVNHEAGCGPLSCVVGVQESTWGSIKAMYR